MTLSRAERLRRALAGLEKLYGKSARVEGGALVDHLVALLLGLHGPASRAEAALALLRDHFVDWNEVRISYAREVRVPLAAAGYEDPAALARELIAMLQRLYRERNAASLDFLDEAGWEPEETFSFFRGFEGLDDGAAAAITARWAEPPRFLQVPEVLRVPGRLGLAGKGATQPRIRKLLEEIAAGEDRIRAHLLFARHGARVCRSRSPRCPECGILELCDYGREQREKSPGRFETATARKEPEKPPAAAAGEKRRKPAARKKPAAGKKPAKKKSAAGKTAAKKAPAGKKTRSKKAAPAKKGEASSRKAPVKKAAPAKKPAPPKKAAAPRKAAGRKAASRKKSPKKAAGGQKGASAGTGAARKSPARRRSR